MPNKGSLELLDLPVLEKRTRSANTSIKKNQEQIERKLNEVRGIKLPAHILKRYEKEFGRKNVNFAFKTFIFAFALVFFIMLFFQPGLSITQENKEIVIKNNSNRIIENVNVQIVNNVSNVFNGGNKIFFTETLNEYEEIRLPVEKENIYMVKATRQMPAINFIIVPKNTAFESNNNESGLNINDPLKEKLKEEYDAS